MFWSLGGQLHCFHILEKLKRAIWECLENLSEGNSMAVDQHLLSPVVCTSTAVSKRVAVAAAWEFHQYVLTIFHSHNVMIHLM